jgi:hypothetical protein
MRSFSDALTILASMLNLKGFKAKSCITRSRKLEEIDGALETSFPGEDTMTGE